MSTEDSLNALRDAIFDGEPSAAVQALEQLKNHQTDPELILKASIMPAIKEIGESMAEGDFFMPEVKISTKVLKEVCGGLKPYVLEQLKLASIETLQWTGEGDIDDIGDYLKNTVAGTATKSVSELMGMLDCVACGLDTHEFTPCKIQGSEAQHQ